MTEGNAATEAQARLDEAHRRLDDVDWRGSAGEHLAAGEWAAAVAAVRAAEEAVGAAPEGGDPIRALWRGRPTPSQSTLVVDMSSIRQAGPPGASSGRRPAAPTGASAPVPAGRVTPGKGAGEGGARGSVTPAKPDMDSWIRARGGRR